MMHRWDSQIDRGMIRVNIGQRIKSGLKFLTASGDRLRRCRDGDADRVLERLERNVRVLRQTVIRAAEQKDLHRP